MADVLTPIQLRGLSEHKYSAVCETLLDPWMQKFWRWLVEQLPMTWAPNTITLTGLVFNVATTLILVYYSPDAKQEIPGWALVCAAFGLFVYQSMDAIDGKQARRTNSSSPLGELFDHGCDAVSIVFLIVGTCLALQLGTDPFWMFFESFSAMFLFYASHWQTYASGTMRFGKIDVTEGQFTIMGVYLVSALFGSSAWNVMVPVVGIHLKYLVLYFSLFSAIMACKLYFYDMFMAGGSGKNGSTIAGTSVLSPLPPVAIVLALAIVICQKSNTGLFQDNPCLYIISFGMVVCKISNKLVIAHMTKSPVEYWDSSYFGPGLLFLNQYFNTFINEYFVLWMCCLYCTADLIRHSAVVCQQICDYMDINCFTIKVPTSPSSTEVSQNLTSAHGNHDYKTVERDGSPEQESNGGTGRRRKTRSRNRNSKK